MITNQIKDSPEEKMGKPWLKVCIYCPKGSLQPSKTCYIRYMKLSLLDDNQPNKRESGRENGKTMVKSVYLLP